MILRELREIDQATDDILVYGWDGNTNTKILTNNLGQLDIVNVNLDIALSDLKTVLDNIDANTDTLETKTQAIRDQLDVMLSTRASESTAQLILDALGVESGTNLLNELQNLTLDTSGLATEATLIEVRDFLDTVETKLQLILDQLDVKLSTRASESTLASVLTELQSIDAKDFATEATLSLMKIAIDVINTDIDVALSTRASESTLDLVRIAVQAIDTDLDVALSTRSSEATLLLVKTNLDDIKTKLDTLNSTDFSTESTLTEVRDTIGQESGATLLSRLLNIFNKLVELFNTGIGKVQIWDGTNIASITDVGRVKIDSSPPDAPPSTTSVVITEFGNVNGADDNIFLIPSGDTLVVQRFSAGAEADTTAGNAIQLFHDPDGDGGSNMVIIDVIFASGTSDQHDLRSEFVGDGTALIRMRRLRFSGGSKEIFGRWEGYH